MTSCLVACMDVSFECMTHGSLGHASHHTIPARMGSPISTYAASLHEGLKCMVRCIDFVRHRKPNTKIVHDMVPDGALDGSIRATNHALSDPVSS